MCEERFLQRARQIAGALDDTPLRELHNYVEPCDSHLLHGHMADQIASQQSELSRLRDRVEKLQKQEIGAAKIIGRIVADHLQGKHEYLDILCTAPLQMIDGEPAIGLSTGRGEG